MKKCSYGVGKSFYSDAIFPKGFFYLFVPVIIYCILQNTLFKNILVDCLVVNFATGVNQIGHFLILRLSLLNMIAF